MSGKPIIAIVSITIPTLASFYVGLPYIGSLIGNIVYLLSVLFLIVFLVISGAWKKIEKGNKSNNYLKRTFELLDPQKALYDYLRGLDKDLAQLNSRAGMLYYHTEDVYKVERILSDINVTKNKTDRAWDFYRNNKYKETYEFILQIKTDISDIKERLDRIEILEAEIPAFEAIFAIAGLLAVAYLLRKRG